MQEYAAVLLAGGAARRMGGRDKPGVVVGGRPMRERVLSAVATATQRIVVGPSVPLPAGVLRTREEPPGGGPVAALAAGLALIDPATPVVAVLAADLPLLTAQHIDELRQRLAATTAMTEEGDECVRADGACYVEDDGRRQWLCGVWRHAALRAAVRRTADARGGDLAGVSMRALLADLTVVEVRWSGVGLPPWFDCDTDADVRRAKEWIG